MQPAPQPQPVYQQAAPQQQVIVGQPAQYTVGVGNTMVGAVAYPATSATTALVLSIVSLFCGGICLAIPGLIFANRALAITDKYPHHPDASTARAAKIISWVIIGISLAVFLLYAVLLAAAVASDPTGY